MAWISGLSKLEHLDMSGMNLSVTQNLDNLVYSIPSLMNLRLSYCGLSMVDLGSRHLNSSREHANIKVVDLSENGFMELPSLFRNMTSLALLDLSGFYVYPRVSTTWSFENLLNMVPSISMLRLSSCRLQKVNFSPTNLNFSTHSNIKHLHLDRNEIEGKIPYVLTNMTSLLSLDLAFNKLSSSIPVIPNLLKLDITANNFRQIEDVGIWRHCNLKELIVSRNNLEGEIIGHQLKYLNALKIHWRFWIYMRMH
ncbi:receptor-like protein 54 [Bidens hawaiensis]|uniref:receptor-like protein 54 n=1 Tax=Bidens hawaiensis TaxID=980011 RepID=UPI00404A8021